MQKYFSRIIFFPNGFVFVPEIKYLKQNVYKLLIFEGEYKNRIVWKRSLWRYKLFNLGRNWLLAHSISSAKIRWTLPSRTCTITPHKSKNTHFTVRTHTASPYVTRTNIYIQTVNIKNPLQLYDLLNATNVYIYAI